MYFRANFLRFGQGGHGHLSSDWSSISWRRSLNRYLRVDDRKAQASIFAASSVDPDSQKPFLTHCRAKKNVKSAIKSWTKMTINQSISPDRSSHFELITLIAQHGEQEHRNFANQLIDDLKWKDDPDGSGKLMTHRDWWAIINYHRLCGNCHQMIHEYHSMMDIGFQPTKYILSSLFEGFIKSGQPHHVESIWKGLIQTHHRSDFGKMFNSRVLQSMIVCIDQSGNQVAESLLFDVWTLLVDEIRIFTELHCFCLAIFVLSKRTTHLQSYELCMKLLHELKGDTKRMATLKQKRNGMYFRQILSSFGNLGNLDEMWAFYDSVKQQRHDDILCVNLLSSMESREDVLRDKVLNGMLGHFVLNQLTSADLIGFYRVAVKCGCDEIKDKMWNILTMRQHDEGIKTNVISIFEYNGTEHVMENGYGSCEFKSVTLVEKIMQEIRYRIDTSPALELRGKVAQERHLKSHSEKKALAVLISNDGDETIRISVSMRMCSDCHQFFCSVSRRYDREIVCIDPKGVHVFTSGSCSLCD